MGFEPCSPRSVVPSFDQRLLHIAFTMTFLNPILAAVALACIAIPIVIHILMRKRRRPVEWGAMRFLMEAYKKQRKRLNLEQLLLLASRCLLVALLAMAVGKPILQAAGALGPRGPRTLYLLIDNSLTAGAADATGATALERHKATALKLVGELEQVRGDRVAVLSLASPADPVILPASVDLSGAGGVVRDIPQTDARADIAGALEKLRDLRDDENAKQGEGDAYIAILSDFRVGAADVDQSLSAFSGAASETRIVALRPAGVGLSNIAVTDVAPLETILLGGTGERVALPLRVNLRRSGEGISAAAVTKVRVEAIRQTKAGEAGLVPPPKASERVVNWKPGEETTSANLTLDLAAGDLGSSGEPILLRTTIDRDSIAGDGVFVRPIESRDRLAVAILAPPATDAQSINAFAAAQWLSLALAPSDDGSLRTRRAGDIAVTRLDPVRDLGEASGGLLGPLTGFDAILVPQPQLVDAAGWRRLRAAADGGASVTVFPPAQEATHAWLDPFQAAFGLDLTTAAEAQEFATPLRLLPPPSEAAGLFAMLVGEFEDLSKSVGVSKSLLVQPRGGSMTAALSLSDGSPLVLVGIPSSVRPSDEAEPSGVDVKAQPVQPVGRGVVVLVTAAMDLSWTDLPAKPMMVPFAQELVRQSVGLASSGRTGVAGQNVAFPVGTVELTPVVLGATDAERAAAGAPIPIDATRALASPIRRAGLWKARASNGAALGMVAVRADTAASRVESRSEAEVASWLSSLGVSVEWLDDNRLTTEASGDEKASAGASVLSSGPQKPPISFPLLIAAMLVAIAEVVMARFFSHARIDDGLTGSAASGEGSGA